MSHDTHVSATTRKTTRVDGKNSYGSQSSLCRHTTLQSNFVASPTKRWNLSSTLESGLDLRLAQANRLSQIELPGRQTLTWRFACRITGGMRGISREGK